MRIEPRREDTDAPLAWDNRQYTAAHAALGGDAYVEHPLSSGGGQGYDAAGPRLAVAALRAATERK